MFRFLEARTTELADKARLIEGKITVRIIKKKGDPECQRPKRSGGQLAGLIRFKEWSAISDELDELKKASAAEPPVSAHRNGLSE